MPRIPNNSVPTGELVRELAGKTITSESRTSADYVVPRTMMLPLTTGTSSGIVLAVQNPESYPLIIRSATLVVLTEAQTSASVDIGIVASSSKTASDLMKGAAASPPHQRPHLDGLLRRHQQQPAVSRLDQQLAHKIDNHYA